MGGCLGQISNVLQNLANEKIDDTELLEEVIYVFDNQNKTLDMDSGPGPPPHSIPSIQTGTHHIFVKWVGVGFPTPRVPKCLFYMGYSHILTQDLSK